MNNNFEKIKELIEKDLDEERTYGYTPVIREKALCEELIDYFKPMGGYVMGGFVRYVTSHSPSPVPYNDIDVFCKDKESFENIKKKIKNDFDNIIIKDSVNSVIITNTLIKSDSVYKKIEDVPDKNKRILTWPEINLIKPKKRTGLELCGNDPVRVMEYFDFTISKTLLVTPEIALVEENCLKNDKHRDLILQYSPNPLLEINRILKYLTKGYRISYYELLKLFLIWEKMNSNVKEEIFKGLSDSALKNQYISLRGKGSKWNLFSINHSEDESE